MQSSGPTERIERHWAPVAGSLGVVALFTAAVGHSVAVPTSLAAASLAIVLFRHRGRIRNFEKAVAHEWARTAAAALTIREWVSPYQAAALHCNHQAVRVRDEAAAEMNAAMMSIVRAPGQGGSQAGGGTSIAQAGHQRTFDAAQMRYQRANLALGLELVAQLARGDLLAKGSPVQHGAEGRERIIPVSHWKALELDIAKAKAVGPEIGYVGLLIGKPGAMGISLLKR